MARFVLVHGAFGGAWCWDRLTPELAAAGHEVEAIDLPGAGEDPTPPAEVTLDAYAERICRALGEGEPAVLVGHSMGGVAITQAAARCPERIASLIYVAAFLPDHGQSLMDLTQLPEAAGDEVQASISVEGDPPVASLSPAGAPHAIFNCCDPEQVAWGVEHLRPQALEPFDQPVDLRDGARADLPLGYVICTRDNAIKPALQRRMLEAAGCREVVELDTDHSPFLSRTSELAAALDRLAAAARAAG